MHNVYVTLTDDGKKYEKSTGILEFLSIEELYIASGCLVIKYGSSTYCIASGMWASYTIEDSEQD